MYISSLNKICPPMSPPFFPCLMHAIHSTCSVSSTGLDGVCSSILLINVLQIIHSVSDAGYIASWGEVRRAVSSFAQFTGLVSER